LPKCIEDIGKQTVLAEKERELPLPKMNTLLRSQLSKVSPPKEMSSDREVLFVEREFKVQVTLGYCGHISLWKTLHLEFLVGEKSGPVKLTKPQSFSIGDDLEHRMPEAENPFAILYYDLQKLCIALLIDIVIRERSQLWSSSDPWQRRS
jgi:mediator of RNA polymerase II transcription subunit 14